MARRPDLASGPGSGTRPRAILAGGGSGGHVFPALAVGAELTERGWSVTFTGNATGMEARLTTERGLAFEPIAARPVVGRGRIAQVRALATLAGSAFEGRRLARRLDAKVVIGTGGYASVPAVAGAFLARRPALLVEPNAKPGAANRWLSRLARGAAVGFTETGQSLACPSTVTGVPVRAAFFDIPQALPAGAPRLLILGGSQGALQINQALPPALALLTEKLPGLEVTHQCGAAHVETTEALYEGTEVNVSVTPFIDDVAAALATSHLVVCRAGAITLAELAAAGRPALLVPLAIAEGHQRDNARRFAEGGAARIPDDDELAAEPLAALLEEALGDRRTLEEMAAAARALAKPRAAAAIADEAERLAGIEPATTDRSRTDRRGTGA